MPGVMECAVVGVPDEKMGGGCEAGHRPERPGTDRSAGARVLPRQPHGLQAARVIEFREELPKTPVGKILRRELRDKK